MIKNFKSWIKSAGIRAIKTLAQTFVATIGTGAAVLGDVNWVIVLSSSVLAAILSLATSMAGLPEVKSNEEEKVETVEQPEEPVKVEEDTQIKDDSSVKEN